MKNNYMLKWNQKGHLALILSIKFGEMVPQQLTRC